MNDVPKFWPVDALNAYPETVGTLDRLELSSGAVWVHLNGKRAKLVGLQSLAFLIGNLQAIHDEVFATAEPSVPKLNGWTCFHCDEHFTDAESASIHFGAHEIQRPACLIDAAEYRSMEERVRVCANEDSELHRQLRRQASNHKLELQRAEERGYAKGLADSRAPIDRDELPEFARTVIAKLVRFRDCAEDGQGVDIGRYWFDTLVQLGLLHRVQRSPAMWEITCEGDALLESRAALESQP